MAKLFDFTLADMKEAINNTALRRELEEDNEELSLLDYLDTTLGLGQVKNEDLKFVVANGDAEDTAIFLAIRQEEERFEGGIPNDELDEALFHITSPQQIDVLIEAGADIDGQRPHAFGDAWTPVMEAIELGREEVAVALIEKGANLSCDWLTVNAMDLAVDMGSTAIINAIEGQQSHLEAQYLDKNTVDAAGAWSPSQADADAFIPGVSAHEVSHQLNTRRL